MTLSKPDKPAKLRGMSGTLVIVTDGNEVDSYGAYNPTATATNLGVPCSLNLMTPAEAVQYGKDTDRSMYRARCPIRHQDGTDIRLEHGQKVIVTNTMFPSGMIFSVVGRGAPQGISGMQMLALIEEPV